MKSFYKYRILKETKQWHNVFQRKCTKEFMNSPFIKDNQVQDKTPVDNSTSTVIARMGGCGLRADVRASGTGNGHVSCSSVSALSFAIFLILLFFSLSYSLQALLSFLCEMTQNDPQGLTCRLLFHCHRR